MENFVDYIVFQCNIASPTVLCMYNFVFKKSVVSILCCFFAGKGSCRGGAVPPHIGYTGMYRWKEYGMVFKPFNSLVLGLVIIKKYRVLFNGITH